MRRTAPGLLLCAWMVALASVAAGDPPAPPSTDEGKDARILARIVGVLPPGDRSIEEVRKALEASDTEEDRDVGYGARRLGLALYGEATTAWITIVARDGHVIAVDVRVPADPKAGATILAAVKAAGRDASGFAERAGSSASWRDAKRMSAWSDAVTAALGGPRAAVELAAPVKDAVAVLRDPLANLRYGTMCGEGGDPPPGRDALELLVKAKSLDGLRLVLASPSPEGRVFAAEGLLRLAEAGTALSKEDRAAVEAVRAAPEKIETCSGCELSTSTAKELLAEALSKR